MGDVGSYRWLLESNATVMTLTAAGPDRCPPREAELAGPWVRADLPPPADSGVTLPAGTYQTSALDVFGVPEASSQLSYTVPDGWKVKEDKPTSFLLHHLADGALAAPATDSFVSIFTQPRLAAVDADGAGCRDLHLAPGIGPGASEIVAGIRARTGVVSTPPVAWTIGGHQGTMIDLRLASSWLGGCRSPQGPVVRMPILLAAGSPTGPSVDLAPGVPLRLILVDLSDQRTLAVMVFPGETSLAADFDNQLADAVPVLDTFEFHPPTH